jgi:hypothetical protein
MPDVLVREQRSDRQQGVECIHERQVVIYESAGVGRHPSQYTYIALLVESTEQHVS